jgi:hypothetical protein
MAVVEIIENILLKLEYATTQNIANLSSELLEPDTAVLKEIENKITDLNLYSFLSTEVKYYSCYETNYPNEINGIFQYLIGRLNNKDKEIHALISQDKELETRIISLNDRLSKYEPCSINNNKEEVRIQIEKIKTHHAHLRSYYGKIQYTTTTVYVIVSNGYEYFFPRQLLDGTPVICTVIYNCTPHSIFDLVNNENDFDEQNFVLTEDEVNQLDSANAVISQYNQQLFKQHSNLTAIQAKFVSKNNIKIQFTVSCKGIIPLKETLLPKKLGGFNTSVNVGVAQYCFF